MNTVYRSATIEGYVYVVQIALDVVSSGFTEPTRIGVPLEILVIALNDVICDLR